MTTDADERLDGIPVSSAPASAPGPARAPRGASVFTSASNLANCAVGAGILSLPYAVRETGAILGLVLCTLVAFVIVFTLRVLVRAGDAYDAASYQELVRKALGPVASVFVSLTLIVYIFGSCVAYTIIVADAVDAVSAAARRPLDADRLGPSRDAIVVVTSVFVLLPLSLLRRTESLGPASTLTIVALAYTVAAVIFEATRAFRGDDDDDDDATERWGWDPADGTATVAGRTVDLWRFDAGTVLALPVFVFAFQCHIQILSIYAELRDEPEKDRRNAAEAVTEVGSDPSDADDDSLAQSWHSTRQEEEMGASWHSTHSRVLDVAPAGADSTLAASEAETTRREEARRRTMERVLTASTLACLAGYLLVGEFAYLSRPAVASNMLKSYDPRDPATLGAVAAMGVSAVVSYPINHFSSRAALDDLLAAAFGWVPAAPGMAPARRHVTQTVAFLALTAATASAVEDLGVVFQLVGSTAGVLVICVVPAALLLRPSPTPTPKVEEFGLEWDDEDGDVVGTGTETGTGTGTIAATTRPRRARRHWTEGGGSIGGYDELGSGGDLRASLLSPDDRDPGLDAEQPAIVGAKRRGRAGDVARAMGLILLGALICGSNVYVIFFARKGSSDDAGADVPPQSFATP